MTVTSDTAEGFARPGTPVYDAATAVFNMGYPPNPRSAVLARDVDAVRRAVRETAAAGERLIPISTGHASALFDRSGDARLIRTELDGDITVDAERQTVTFPAGTTWGPIGQAIAPHGLAVPHGTSPTVGAVGYLLGGGMSYYGRARGIASNHVESFRIVLADGEEHSVDADHDPDLFWALRGGGGGFGVVTSATVRLFPLREVLTGMAVWPAALAERITRMWRDWAADAPRSVTTNLRLLNLPPLPHLPPALTSGQVIAVDGVSIPEGEDVSTAARNADALLSRLREAGEPLLDSWHSGPTTDVTATHGDPQEPVPGSLGDSFSVPDFSDAAAAAWLHAAGPDAEHKVAMSELRQLRGAFEETPPAGGAFDHIDGDVLMVNIDVVPDSAAMAASEAANFDIRRGMGDHVSNRTAPTLVDNRTSPQRTFPPEVEQRVDAIRRRVDPDGVFAFDTRRSVDA